MNNMAFALIVCALLATSALAGGTSEDVTFRNDMTVGDTLVKQGKYKVTFDDESRELVIMRGRKIVARAAADLEDLERGGRFPLMYTSKKADDGTSQLVGVVIGGKNAVINRSRTAAAPASKSAGQ
jgi:hypothetical protein